jgi:flagellar motor switch/type III secretory pathway protein FliN
MPTEITQANSPEKMEGGEKWDRVSKLSCELTVELAVSSFRARDLGLLRVGRVFDSGWSLAREVPVLANGLRLAWGQFEVVGRNLAVRLSELAEEE